PMAQETAQERTEEATPRRRLEARRKGTVAKSTELTSSLVVLGLVLTMPVAASQLGLGFMSGMQNGIRNIPTDLNFSSIKLYCWSVASPCLIGLGMIIATAMVIGVASNFAQVGFVLSGEALMPSFAKLNPMN